MLWGEMCLLAAANESPRVDVEDAIGKANRHGGTRGRVCS